MSDDDEVIRKVTASLLNSNDTPFHCFCAGVAYAMRYQTLVSSGARECHPKEILAELRYLRAAFDKLLPLTGVRKDVAEVYLKVLNEEASAV